MNLKTCVVLVSVALGASGSSWAAKMISYKGKVTAHPSGKLKVLVSDGSTGDWTLDPKAVVMRAGKRMPENEIHAGDEVSLTVSEDGVIHRVAVMSAPKKGAAARSAGYWGTQKGKGRWWTGEVYELNEGSKEFGVRQVGGTATTHFKADDQTTVYVKPHSGKNRKESFGAVRDGATVDAYSMNGRTTQIVVHE